MPNFHRACIPGGSFLFTLVTNGRAKLFRQHAAREPLGTVFGECLAKWPFAINALFLLPEHLHAIWSLPPGDSDAPRRWGCIKKEFTQRWLAKGGREEAISASRRSERLRGIRQPRSWEHALEDENDFERHFDNIHDNPVKHGHFGCPRDLRWSSFHRWVKAGV